jgi:DNA adenine methylase
MLSSTHSSNNSNMRYISPLRYPGGKARLANFLKSVFETNDLVGGAYAEPYAGGAGAALALLISDHAANIYINDIDPGIHAFWFSVLRRTESFCRLVRNTPVTPSEWERQRRIYANASTETRLASGFAAFFLNRTNRSGIIDSGSMIGGRDQAGQWKLDARYNREGLISRIELIAKYRRRIHLSSL